jgi:hypothetical protein
MKDGETFIKELELNVRGHKDWKLASLAFNEFIVAEFPDRWEDTFRRCIPHLKMIGTMG